MQKYVKVENEKSANLANNGLNEIDLYVYASVKRFINYKTRTAFPSTTTLTEITKLSKPTIIKAIKQLESAGYIVVRRKHYNTYFFPPEKDFKKISVEFLDHPELTPKEKGFIIALRQYILHGTEFTLYQRKELAIKIGISISTVNRRIKQLEKKGIIKLSLTINRQKTILDFKKLKLQVDKNSKAIKANQEEIEALRKELEELKAIIYENRQKKIIELAY